MYIKHCSIRPWKLKLGLFLLVVSALYYCEYYLYYAVISKCSWPELSDSNALRAMFIADTHLLGARNGAWIDRVRREWQLQRSFATALELHKPEVVFILGDLFDEGKWATEDDWEDTFKRFKRIFNHPPEVTIIPVIGNHDVGFHYQMDEWNVHRYERDIGPSVAYRSVKGIDFMLINSMALKDDCALCEANKKKFYQAKSELTHNQSRGDRYKNNKTVDSNNNTLPYNPIILSHFPLFRESEALCIQTDDPMITLDQSYYEKLLLQPKKCHYNETIYPKPMCSSIDPITPKDYVPPYYNIPGKDVMTADNTRWLLYELTPRFVFSGHTHSYCSYEHHDYSPIETIPEVTVSTFMWRNRFDPSFVLSRISANRYAEGPVDYIDKSTEMVYTRSGIATKTCSLPLETTVFKIYTIAYFALVIGLVALASITGFFRDMSIHFSKFIERFLEYCKNDTPDYSLKGFIRTKNNVKLFFKF